MLLYGIVTQVYALLSRTQIEMLGAETKIAILVHPNGQRVAVGDEKPLADVEFRLVNEQRTFDVFLYDVLSIVG